MKFTEKMCWISALIFLWFIIAYTMFGCQQIGRKLFGVEKRYQTEIVYIPQILQTTTTIYISVIDTHTVTIPIDDLFDWYKPKHHHSMEVDK